MKLIYNGIQSFLFQVKILMISCTATLVRIFHIGVKDAFPVM